jgi:hypothetical protein
MKKYFLFILLCFLFQKVCMAEPYYTPLFDLFNRSDLLVKLKVIGECTKENDYWVIPCQLEKVLYDPLKITQAINGRGNFLIKKKNSYSDHDGFFYVGGEYITFLKKADQQTNKAGAFQYFETVGDKDGSVLLSDIKTLKAAEVLLQAGMLEKTEQIMKERIQGQFGLDHSSEVGILMEQLTVVLNNADLAKKQKLFKEMSQNNNPVIVQAAKSFIAQLNRKDK